MQRLPKHILFSFMQLGGSGIKNFFFIPLPPNAVQPHTFWNYRKRGSASYIVRQWLLWEGERERERERRLWRHWYHTEIASDHAYDYLDGALTQRVDAFWLWACRALELRSACKDKELGAWALDWAAGSSDGWMTPDDGEVEALRSLVRLPWIIQQHFVGMLQARRIDQVDVYLLFEWPWFYLWEQLG